MTPETKPRQKKQNQSNSLSELEGLTSSRFHPLRSAVPMASIIRRPSNLTAVAVRFRLTPLLQFSGSSGSVNSDKTRFSELIRVPSLVEGCDYKHWLVLMKPPNGYPPRNDIVRGFIRTLSMALGR